MNTTAGDIYAPVLLRAAYGRKYQTKKSAIHDWESGLDFKISGGGYCSIRDVKLLQDNYTELLIQTDQGIVRL